MKKSEPIKGDNRKCGLLQQWRRTSKDVSWRVELMSRLGRKKRIIAIVKTTSIDILLTTNLSSAMILETVDFFLCCCVMTAHETFLIYLHVGSKLWEIICNKKTPIWFKKHCRKEKGERKCRSADKQCSFWSIGERAWRSDTRRTSIEQRTSK